MLNSMQKTKKMCAGAWFYQDKQEGGKKKTKNDVILNYAQKKP